MSLRAFHLVFIAAAALLALYLCGWCSLEHQRTHAPGLLAGALLSFLAAAALTAYGAWARRRYRDSETGR